MAEGHLVQSKILPEHIADVPDGSVVVEHAPIRFPNYPYEWAAEMLNAAAGLTLYLAEQSARAGFGLKDATPHNIMFEGAKPVFLDLLSFEKSNSLEGLWRPYAQFVRTFLYPLLASRVGGLRLDEIFMVHRDGLEPERAARTAPLWRLLTPPLFGLITLPLLLSKRADRSGPQQFRERPCRDHAEAEYLKRRVFARASKTLEKVSGLPRKRSTTARYLECEQSYTAAEFGKKDHVVTDILRKYRPERILDAGCNTGHFSLIAAKAGASVVAIDRDESAIGLLWEQAAAESVDVLPLVIDLARPTPAVGWANGEGLSFLSRAEGRFDCVLMLALLHHLTVSERVPLDRIFDLAAGLTTDLLILEYVDPSDPQFQRIVRGREALHRDLSKPGFESAAETRFRILEHFDVSVTRCIYVLKKRSC